MTVVHQAELVDEIPAPRRAAGDELAGLAEDLILRILGLRGGAISTADALFGAPSWLVPATLAVGAAGAVGLYAAHLRKGKRKRVRRRR